MGHGVGDKAFEVGKYVGHVGGGFRWRDGQGVQHVAGPGPGAHRAVPQGLQIAHGPVGDAP